MSATQTTRVHSGRASSKREPKHVYSIIERGEDTRPFWLRVGSCFENRDGSFNVYLDALPRDGKLQIRDALAAPEAAR